MQFLYVFRKILYYVPKSTQRKKRAMHFLRRTLQCFDSETLQNDSKGVEQFQQLSFCATCVLFESFCCQNVSKRSTNTELIVNQAFKGIFADFG